MLIWYAVVSETEKLVDPRGKDSNLFQWFISAGDKSRAIIF